MPDADTLITAAPTELATATRPPERAHRVLWFAVGLGLFTIDAGLASVMLGVSRAIWHW